MDRVNKDFETTGLRFEAVLRADGALDLWGNCGQREGSILMFGDAELRDRITGVLREPDLLPRQKATAVAQ